MSKDIYDKPMMPEQCTAPAAPDAPTPRTNAARAVTGTLQYRYTSHAALAAICDKLALELAVAKDNEAYATDVLHSYLGIYAMQKERADKAESALAEAHKQIISLQAKVPPRRDEQPRTPREG